MPHLGFQELAVVFLVIFLLFGPDALMDIAKKMGQFFGGFKKSVNDIKDKLEDYDDSEENKS